MLMFFANVSEIAFNCKDTFQGFFPNIGPLHMLLQTPRNHLTRLTNSKMIDSSFEQSRLEICNFTSSATVEYKLSYMITLGGIPTIRNPTIRNIRYI